MIDHGCVISLELVDVSSNPVEFAFSVPLTTLVALFEKFYVTYLESLATTVPTMRSPKIVKIAKTKVYFHAILSCWDL